MKTQEIAGINHIRVRITLKHHPLTVYSMQFKSKAAPPIAFYAKTESSANNKCRLKNTKTGWTSLSTANLQDVGFHMRHGN